MTTCKQSTEYFLVNIRNSCYLYTNRFLAQFLSTPQTDIMLPWWAEDAHFASLFKLRRRKSGVNINMTDMHSPSTKAIIDLVNSQKGNSQIVEADNTKDLSVSESFNMTYMHSPSSKAILDLVNSQKGNSHRVEADNTKDLSAIEEGRTDDITNNDESPSLTPQSPANGIGGLFKGLRNRKKTGERTIAPRSPARVEPKVNRFDSSIE